MTYNAKMTLFNAPIESDIRSCQYAESSLLQLIDTIEHGLDSMAKIQGSIRKFINESKENEKKLRTQLEIAQANRQADRKAGLSRMLIKVLADRRKTMDRVRKQERSLRNAVSDFKTNFRNYLELRKSVQARSLASAFVQTERGLSEEEHQAQGGLVSGLGNIWSTLGMALFAWKTSNAFDDLAKISGRKK